MTDEQLGDLVVRFAVVESLTLHLAAAMADTQGNPTKAAQAILADLREAFSTGSNPAVESFEKQARSHLDRLEPRLLRLVLRDRGNDG